LTLEDFLENPPGLTTLGWLWWEVLHSPALHSGFISWIIA
jgi:hypothetical protein